jgi:hypothetical protein
MIETRVEAPEVFPVSEFCAHAKVVIPDPLSDDDWVEVDAEIAPLIAELRDGRPIFACQDETGEGDSVFVFADRGDAVDFIRYVADFGRSGGFSVDFFNGEISVNFPRTWIPGLTEHIRTEWEALEEHGASTGPRPARSPSRTRLSVWTGSTSTRTWPR